MSEPTTVVAPIAAPVVEAPKKPESPLAEIRRSLTETEKENFFKAFVSDQPYIAEIPVFGDKLKIKFRTLSVAENQIVLQQQRYDKEAGLVNKDDEYVIRVIQYRLAASLVSINEEPFCPDIVAETPGEPNTTYLVKRVAAMEKWPIFKLSNISDAFNKFEVRTMALTEESFKETF